MRKWYPWLLVGIAFGFSIAVYGRLPERIPTHWDARGVVNGDTARAWGAWLMPTVLLIMAILLPRLPAIDPFRANYEKFRPTYDLVVAGVATMITALHVAMLGVGLGWPISMERLTPLLAGGLFILIGNVMPRARPNWLFGIRTPWTLTNDRVWERTHRLGGYLFVIAGILIALSGFLRPAMQMPVFIATITVAAIIPLAYSYFAWKQETSRAPNS
jgi:uncharacterized membrane protein